jgi:hypothetical protein
MSDKNDVWSDMEKWSDAMLAMAIIVAELEADSSDAQSLARLDALYAERKRRTALS